MNQSATRQSVSRTRSPTHRASSDSREMLRLLPALLLLAPRACTSWTLPSRAATFRRSPAVAVSMALQAPGDENTVNALIEQTRDSAAIVVLYFCDPSADAAPSNSWDTPSWDSGGSWSPQLSMSSMIVERCANEYASSQLYGGAPVVVLQIDADMAPGNLI